MQPKRWIDYQDAFVKRSGFSRAISLSEALMLCDMQPCGRLHDGLDDAINTAKLIEILIQITRFVTTRKNLQFQRSHCSFAWEICLRG